jgi:hypothetical protein
VAKFSSQSLYLLKLLLYSMAPAELAAVCSNSMSALLSALTGGSDSALQLLQQAGIIKSVVAT